MLPLVYTGGSLKTHAYLIPNKAETAYLCFDAPEGLAAEVLKHGLRIEALLLTHGHSDHIWDAAFIHRDHGCPVYLHANDRPLLVRKDERFPSLSSVEGLPVERGTAAWNIGGRQFTLFHIPGHSPGSVAFYEAAEERIFAGDVLFSGGIGRCQSPALREELLDGINRFLLPLPDSTAIYPGHGPSTYLGDEKRESYFERYLTPSARHLAFTQPTHHEIN